MAPSCGPGLATVANLDLDLDLDVDLDPVRDGQVRGTPSFRPQTPALRCTIKVVG